MRRLKRVLFALFFCLGLLVGSLLCVSLVFPVTIAQWALDQLRSHGLQGRVLKADILEGELHVDRLSFVRTRPASAFVMHAQEGLLKLSVWGVILGRRTVPEIHVNRPKIRVWRGAQAIKKAASSVQRRDKTRKLQRLRKLLQRLRKRRLRVDWLHIRHAQVEFVDESRPTQKTSIRFGEFNVIMHGFLGDIEAHRVKVTLQKPEQSLTMEIPRVDLRLQLDRFLDKGAIVERVVLHKPHWLLKRYKRPSAAARKKRRLRRKAMQRRLRLASPKIRLLRIVGGRFTLQDRSRKGRPVDLSVHRLDADLKQLAGTMTIHDGKLTTRGPRQSVALQWPRATIRLDLSELFASPLTLQSISLWKPSLTLTSHRRTKPRPKKNPKWLHVKRLQVEDGKLNLHMPLKNRKTGKNRKVAIRLVDIKTDLQGIDLRYLLAHPFTGKGYGTFPGHGVILFFAKPLASRTHRFALRQLPMTLLNKFVGEQTPVHIRDGRFRGSLTFSSVDADTTQVNANFQVRGLKASVGPGRPGLKKLAIRVATALLNRFFAKNPAGYKLRTHFLMRTDTLASEPPALLRKLSHHLKDALVQTLTQRHPRLAKIRKMIERRKAKRNAKGPFAKWREQRKKVRETRRKQRQTRREQRQKRFAKWREQRKKAREARRKKRKQRWENFKKRW